MAAAAPVSIKVPTGHISGHVPSSALDAVVAEGGFKSWLCLLPSYTEEQCPEAAIRGKGIEFAQIPLEVPTDLNNAKAEALMKAMESLPQPIMVQCATANRAGAVVALHLGRKEGWNIGQVRDWAGASALKFATVAPLLTWVSDNLAPAATLPAAAIAGPLRSPNLIFRQLFEPVTCTFTYLLACAATREAVLIDPVQEMADRDAKLLKELGLSLKYGINTHAHADHISGTHKLRAYYPGMKSVIGRASGAKADVHVEHGDTISFGLRSLKALSTPGHTNGCMSFLMDDSTAVFTGDALFVRGCGRTDFQAGDSRKLYRGIHEHLFTLPPATVVFPGHDYKGMLYSTIGEEAALNPRLTQSEEGFVELMANLGLPKPKQIDIAVPANLEDGVPQPVAAPAAPPA